MALKQQNIREMLLDAAAAMMVGIAFAYRPAELGGEEGKNAIRKSAELRRNLVWPGEVNSSLDVVEKKVGRG